MRASSSTALRRFDEHAVGAGLEIKLGAAQRFVEPVHRARVGAGDQEGVGIAPRRRGRAQLRGHHGRVDHVLAGHVAAALGRALVLDEDRRDPHRLVTRDRMGDVLDVAIAVVAVDQDRQPGRRHDVADAGAHLAEAHQPDVGQGMARADQRKAADRIGRKAGALDQPRRERVMRAGQQQRLLALQQLLPCRLRRHGRIGCCAHGAALRPDRLPRPLDDVLRRAVQLLHQFLHLVAGKG